MTGCGHDTGMTVIDHVRNSWVKCAYDERDLLRVVALHLWENRRV